MKIQAVLHEDKASGARLRHGNPAPDAPSFEGYCGVATNAYFFLRGEQLAGFDPLTPAEKVNWETAGTAARDAGFHVYQLSHPGGSHWWLAHSPSGEAAQLIDLTIGPGDRPSYFPYEEGRRRGFMMNGYKRPSKRALDLIEQVKAARTG